MRRSVSWEFRGFGWSNSDQQVAERGEASPAEVTESLLRGVGHGAIETTEHGSARGSDSIGAAAAIVGIGAAHDEFGVLQTRHQARQVGIARDHPGRDLGARESAPPRRAENAEDAVLRR